MLSSNYLQNGTMDYSCQTKFYLNFVIKIQAIDCCIATLVTYVLNKDTCKSEFQLSLWYNDTK